MKQLSQTASANELYDLSLNHKNAVVKLYALMALKRKKYAIPENIIESFKNNKSKVAVLNGCNGGYKSVNVLAKLIIENNLQFALITR